MNADHYNNVFLIGKGFFHDDEASTVNDIIVSPIVGDSYIGATDLVAGNFSLDSDDPAVWGPAESEKIEVFCNRHLIPKMAEPFKMALAYLLELASREGPNDPLLAKFDYEFRTQPDGSVIGIFECGLYDGFDHRVLQFSTTQVALQPVKLQ